uniref:hypothetical protein n=1 Tax=Clostridioides sp. ES-S-0173-01 TaxID=2770786 RepID=UPI001E40FD5C|nr:hypothetical protein [Clostridioides sp. ES-S-0173-01]UDN49525.1 hypothetical protein JJJ25_18960 [Clostridioides sp. ES-S-0173-01]
MLKSYSVDEYIKILRFCTSEQLIRLDPKDIENVTPKSKIKKINNIKKFALKKGQRIINPGYSFYYDNENDIFIDALADQDKINQDELILTNVYIEFKNMMNICYFNKDNGVIPRIYFYQLYKNNDEEDLKRFDIIYCNPSEQNLVEILIQTEEDMKNILIVLNENSLTSYREFKLFKNKMIAFVLVKDRRLLLSDKLSDIVQKYNNYNKCK